MYRTFISLAVLILFTLTPASSLCPSPQTDTRIEIYNLRHYTHPNFTRIVVDIGTLREYNSGELPSPDRIYVDIYQAKLNPILHQVAIPVNNDYLNQIRIAQRTSTSVRMVVELDFAKIKHYRLFHLFDPFRVVLDIYPKEATAAPPPTEKKPPQPAQPSKSGFSLIRQLGLGVKTIVIDPGHGGSDPGCITKSGQREKEIVLDVSARLAKLLQAQNSFEVVMTRESDISVPVENRTVIANQKQADLFISIHVNSFRDKNRRGIECFYLNLSPDRSVNEIAARENATTTKNISEMREIMNKIVQYSKSVESRELAQKIQVSLVSCLARKYDDIKNLGAKGGPFWVLIGGEMPSVLIEISHLSNSSEAGRLKTSAYRQQVAQGIFDGIMEYIKSLGKG